MSKVLGMTLLLPLMSSSPLVASGFGLGKFQGTPSIPVEVVPPIPVEEFFQIPVEEIIEQIQVNVDSFGMKIDHETIRALEKGDVFEISLDNRLFSFTTKRKSYVEKYRPNIIKNGEILESAASESSFIHGQAVDTQEHISITIVGEKVVGSVQSKEFLYRISGNLKNIWIEKTPNSRLNNDDCNVVNPSYSQ